MKKRSLFFAFALSLLFLGFVSAKIAITGDVISEKDLKSSTIFLRVGTSQGGGVTKPIVLTSDSGGHFFLEVIGAKGVSLEESELFLGYGESREILVRFDSSLLEPGSYAGSIKIIGPEEVFYLPLVFDVETEDLFFDINIEVPPQYSTVAPGGRFLAQLKVFDLTGFQDAGSLGPTSVDMEYSVVSLDGNVLVSETESSVVDRKTQFTKILFLPESIEEGDYFFTTSVKYRSSVGISSYLFSVKNPEILQQSNESDRLAYFVVFLVAAFLAIVFLVIYFVRERDKLILELRKHNESELRKQREFLVVQAKFLARENKKIPKKIKMEISENVKILKAEHKKRIGEFKKLKKKGDIQQMKRRLQEWKRKGYNTSAMEYKLRDLSKGEMQKLLGEWKRKYKK